MKFYRSGWFWVLSFFVVSGVLFVIFGGRFNISFLKDPVQRFFIALSIILIVLLVIFSYFFFSKEETRERRREERRIHKEKKALQKKLKAEKKALLKNLKKSFYRALSELKNTKTYGKLYKHHYELPWYLVVGENEDVRRNLMRYSGFEFPLESKESNDKAIQESEGFVWYFAEEAVFVSISEKYLYRENKIDEILWEEFLRLLKKERRRRPINGVLLCFEAAKRLKNSQSRLNSVVEDAEDYARKIKEILHQISTSLHLRIPVYIFITDAGSIEGFSSFFHALTYEEKKEILGITFSESEDVITAETIEVKFSDLFSRMEAEVALGLQNAWSHERKREVFLFLDHFRKLAAFSAFFALKCFSPGRYRTELIIRGIYFTDLSSIYKEVEQVDTAIVKHGDLSLDNHTRGYFLPKVFSKIILSEKSLAKVFDEYKRRSLAYSIAGLSVLGAAFAFVMFYWAHFLGKESEEVTKLKDIYAQYKSLQHVQNDASLSLVRKAYAPQGSIKIGKLGGDKGGDLNFESSKAQLTVHAKSKLLEMLEMMHTFDESTRIKIVGHTDSIGSEEYNKNLSLKRARAVKDFFVSHGFDPSRIETIGAGEESPIASNQTVEGRSLNRRVEIFAYGREFQKSTPSYEETYVIDNHLSRMQRVLGMLDALYSMRGDENISYEFWKPGFYAIDTRNKKIDELYVSSLESLLLPEVKKIMEKELLSDLDSEKKTQTNLKAYLMLANPSKRDSDFLKDYMMQRWGSELEDSEIDRINRHFANLLRTDFAMTSLNQRVIFKARRKLLSRAGKAGMIYKNLQEAASRKGISDVMFLDVLDAYPNALEGTQYRIPGFYTKEGYEKIILPRLKPMVRQAMDKSWIIGDKSDNTRSQEIERIYQKVLSLYFRDYRRHWSKALSTVTLPRYHTLKELVEQLELLSSGSSPVVEILRELKRHTYLLTPQEKAEKLLRKKRAVGVNAGDVLGKVGRKIDTLQRIGTKSEVKFSGDRYVYDLREVFGRYHELIDKKGMPARKLRIALRQTEKAYQIMLGIDTAPNPKEAAFKVIKKDNSASFALKSALLPEHILKWYNEALKNSRDYLDGLVSGHVQRSFHDDIWIFYKERIHNRFPLNLSSKHDIKTEDFKRFFKKGGLLDSFYEKYIERFVDVDFSSGKFKIKKINGSKISVSEKMVRSMIEAKRFRSIFFDSSGTDLRVEFRVTPKYLSPSLSAMDLTYEDQDFIYEHGPKSTKVFVWPTKYSDAVAKFNLYDYKSERVVKVRGEGEWAFWRLLKKTDIKIVSKNKMILSYRKGEHRGVFEIQSKGVLLYNKKANITRFSISNDL